MKRCAHCGQYLRHRLFRWLGGRCLPGYTHLPLSPEAYGVYIDNYLDRLVRGDV